MTDLWVHTYQISLLRDCTLSEISPAWYFTRLRSGVKSGLTCKQVSSRDHNVEGFHTCILFPVEKSTPFPQWLRNNQSLAISNRTPCVVRKIKVHLSNMQGVHPSCFPSPAAAISVYRKFTPRAICWLNNPKENNLVSLFSLPELSKNMWTTPPIPVTSLLFSHERCLPLIRLYTWPAGPLLCSWRDATCVSILRRVIVIAKITTTTSAEL